MLNVHGVHGGWLKFGGGLRGPLPRMRTMNQTLGAPGTAPGSWQTAAPTEPSRCSALRFHGFFRKKLGLRLEVWGCRLVLAASGGLGLPPASGGRRGRSAAGCSTSRQFVRGRANPVANRGTGGCRFAALRGGSGRDAGEEIISGKTLTFFGLNPRTNEPWSIMAVPGPRRDGHISLGNVESS
jgi:hypothetical protein